MPEHRGTVEDTGSEPHAASAEQQLKENQIPGKWPLLRCGQLQREQDSDAGPVRKLRRQAVLVGVGS